MTSVREVSPLQAYNREASRLTPPAGGAKAKVVTKDLGFTFGKFSFGYTTSEVHIDEEAVAATETQGDSSKSFRALLTAELDAASARQYLFEQDAPETETRAATTSTLTRRLGTAAYATMAQTPTEAQTSLFSTAV